MKSVVLQKAVNVVKSKSWTSAIDFRYLDETSEFKFESDRIRAQKHGQVYTPKPWEALPYLAKDEVGKIHVRGFLHDHVAQNSNGTFNHPSSLSTEEIIRRLGRAWNTHAKTHRETQVSHHRLVFSFSNEFHDALVKAGRNPDMALRGIIERSMRSFQEKFHPGDSVAYCYGIHHDTDNLHAHVFIHPRTRKGAFVGMSEQLQKKAARQVESRHKNQLKFVRENARHRAGEVLEEISDPKKAAYLKNNLHSDRIFFIPRQSHFFRTKNDYRPRTPSDYQLEQKRAPVAALDKRIAGKRADFRDAMGGRNIATMFRIKRPKWLRLIEQAQTAKLFRELRELQAQRYQLFSEYRASRRRLLPAPDATKTVPRRSKRAKPSVSAIKTRPTKPTVTIASKSPKSKIRL